MSYPSSLTTGAERFGHGPNRLSQSTPNHGRVLFFAVLPSAEAKKDIASLVAASRQHWGLGGPGRPERIWHATLQEVGSDEPIFRDFAMDLGARISVEAFDVSFDRVMSFSGPNAFVLTGDGPGVAGLHELRRKLIAEFKALGFSPKGSFRPHVTMLYDRQLVPQTVIRRPISWRVKEVVLVLSHQGLTRHDYVARWPLIEQAN